MITIRILIKVELASESKMVYSLHHDHDISISPVEEYVIEVPRDSVDDLQRFVDELVCQYRVNESISVNLLEWRTLK